MPHHHEQHMKRWSPETNDKLAAAIRKLHGKKEISENWHDPTDGSKIKRRAQLKKCGPQCYGEPDPENPKYPVCNSDCRPVCDGVSAAMTYAKIYNNKDVRRNLKAALAACHDIRREMREDDE